LLKSVEVAPRGIEAFRALLGDRYPEIEEAASRAREFFAGRVIWQVNSTAQGGGVAEMLQTYLAYVRALGIDTRWMVVGDGEEFFTVTKRLHNYLHGSPGDGGPLGEEERRIYEEGLEDAGRQLCELVRPGDIAFLHDPQTAVLTAAMREAGTHVFWRSHVGADRTNDLVDRAWEFLGPYVSKADGVGFSRQAYVWKGLDPDMPVYLIPPSIDPFSPKNEELDTDTVRSVLDVAGIGPDGSGPVPTFVRSDGTPGRVERHGELIQEGPVPEDVRLVAQVSRWDRLKDPVGVIACFAEHLKDGDAHLLLAGPDVRAVTDDPEGAEVLEEVKAARSALPGDVSSRVHLATLPMDDIEENAVIVNAIQRRADVIVQKSLAEGFGLTVSEAMWKGTPVVAGAVGGIQDQIEDGETGLLADPADLQAVAVAIDSLLADPERAARIGEAGRRNVAENFLVTGRLTYYLELFEDLIARTGPQASAA
jgi:trehalose synthase